MGTSTEEWAPRSERVQPVMWVMLRQHWAWLMCTLHFLQQQNGYNTHLTWGVGKGIKSVKHLPASNGHWANIRSLSLLLRWNEIIRFCDCKIAPRLAVPGVTVSLRSKLEISHWAEQVFNVIVSSFLLSPSLRSLWLRKMLNKGKVVYSHQLSKQGFISPGIRERAGHTCNQEPLSWKELSQVKIPNPGHGDWEDVASL